MPSCLRRAVVSTIFIKDRLAETDRVHNTFDTIVTVATNIDKRRRERMVEKAREAGRSAPSTSSKPSGSHQASLFQQHSADPDTMDINTRTSGAGNGKTQEDWRKALRGKCYGCKSDEHTIAKGCSSKCTICQWCKKAGHTSMVCMTRYLGRPQNDGPPQPQAVRASVIPEASGSSSTSLGNALAAISEDVAAMV